MKNLVSILLILIFSMLASASIAQDGAVVTKGTYEDAIAWEYNEADGFFYLFTTFSDVCGYPGDLGEVMELPWMIVHRPKDDEDKPWDGKYIDNGFWFVRVLDATPDEFWDDPGPCATWGNPDLIVADGAVHSTLNDNDQFPANTNRQNVWGFTANGALEDYGDNCAGEMVGLKFQWRAQMDDDFPACIPACNVRVVSQKGPQLKCN